MKKVALTGNIGCGKSTVAGMFRELGAFTVDADQVIRSFYRKGSPVYQEVLEEFGEEILSENGDIDRRKLADIVFKDREKLEKLEKITHRALYQELERLYSQLKEDTIVVVEASLLIEKGTYKNYDRTVVVYAPYEVCKERALRKGFTEEDFERRWRNQMDIEEKVKYADYVIDNSNGLEKTLRQVKELFERIKEDP
ncbi:dephospho-CoA kinase [Hydrogenivirga caldilitoris]|uniref:Dephospho-CoA kinase n=1 Tax=Hydrogenivirga caldilitoris TaxID=246264 RepID=A0A497XT20_9AQUI|nr:dephospho-CoA kinase [Hydrogenivirga caldilitoris]RLJ71320.1 dephospho-CoA kinase [Hydrogenivirga caldilitoris]